MAGVKYIDPVRAIAGSQVYPGASLSVFESGTETVVPLFADPGLGTPLPNPITADAAGRFPPLYVPVEANRAYRLLVRNSDGNVVIDEGSFTPLTAPLSPFDASPRDDAGRSLPLATRTFYQAQTTEPATIFADEALTTPQTNPVTADASGDFPDIWLDVEKAHRVILRDQHGRLIYDIDQYEFHPEIVPPTAPVLSGELDGSDIDLSWTAAVSPFGAIAGYRLYNAATHALIVDTQDPEILAHTDGPLEAGNTYSYYVIAYDTAGNDSPRSNIVSISVQVLMEVITQTQTWVKPDGLISVDVVCIGAGGGGGSGACTPGGNHRGGGGGGGGGGISTDTLDADDVSDSVLVTIGAGGQGGQAISGNAFGEDGDDGGDTSFGAYVVAGGGKGGKGGRSGPGSGAAGGDGGAGGIGSLANGGDGGDGNSGSGDPAAQTGGSSAQAAGGGGGGSGRNPSGPADAASGGAGDTADENNLGGAAGVDLGDAGDPGESTATHKPGGGGGGGRVSAIASGSHGGDGGDGGNYGGGGAGGGAATTSTGAQSGAGGNGAPGVVVLFYTYAESP